MRFYFGFSKKIPIKWIITAILGILAFFGFTKVHALELTDMDYVTDDTTYFTTGRYNLSDCGSSGNGCTLSFNFSKLLNKNAEFLVVKYVLSNSTNTGLQGTYPYSEVLSYSPAIIDENYVGTLCQVSNGYFICPIDKNKNYRNINLSFVNTGGYSTITVYSRFYFYNSRGNSQYNAIIEGQQQIVDSQNNINNSINDDNTSESSSSANSFFSDFDISDSKGITAVILAPINFLENLLTYSPNSCTPLTLNLNMSDDNLNQSSSISFPCGSVLWSRAPQSVVNVYYILIWGLFGYRVLIGLNKFFNDMVNPESVSEFYLDL